MTDHHPSRPIVHPDPPLSDGVVTLRPLAPGDFEDVQAAIADPEIPRFTNVVPGQDVDRTRRFIERTVVAWADGSAATFAMTDASDGRLLGCIDLNRSGDDPEIAQIGYWVAAEARGRGVASRATALIAEWGFRCFGVERIEILIHETNEGSQRVAARTGFRREGELRGYRAHHDGQRVDLLMFGRLKGDPGV